MVGGGGRDGLEIGGGGGGIGGGGSRFPGDDSGILLM